MRVKKCLIYVVSNNNTLDDAGNNRSDGYRSKVGVCFRSWNFIDWTDIDLFPLVRNKRCG